MLTNETLIFPEQASQKQLEQEGIKRSDRDEREKETLAVSCWGAGWLLILLILLYWPMIFFFPAGRELYTASH